MTAPRVLVAVTTLAGAIVLSLAIASSSEQLRDSSNRWALVAVVPLSFLAIAAYRSLAVVLPLGFGPLTLVGIGLVGAACVPETDQLPLLIATCVGLAIIEWVTRCRLEPRWAILAAGGILMWGLLYGAVGRPSALVGALFAWWPLLLAGAAARLIGSRWHTIAAIALGGLAAGVVARTGGVGDSGTEAVRWASGAALASTLLVAVSLAVPGGLRVAVQRLRRQSARSDGGSHPKA